MEKTGNRSEQQVDGNFQCYPLESGELVLRQHPLGLNAPVVRSI